MSDEVQWILWNFLRAAHSGSGEPDFDALLRQLQGQDMLDADSLQDWPDPALVAFRNVVQDFLGDIHEAEQAGSNAFCARKFLHDATQNNLTGPILSEILDRSGGNEKVWPLKKSS